MSLIGALNIGSNALAVQQAAVQVTGNNIANAGNADYTRQTANLTPGSEQQIQQGIFIGDGVSLNAIQRQIDDALQGRLNTASSNSSAATATQNYLGQVESSINALGTENLSTQLGTFFSDWSSLANKPQDTGQRQVVIQDGQNLAKYISGLRSQLTGIQTGAGSQLAGDIKEANSLAQQVADLNGQIVVAQGGATGSANSLLDKRDAAVAKLSTLADVSTVAQSNGTVNVYIGSEPLVVATNNRGLKLGPQTGAQGSAASVVFSDNNGTATISSGEIGGLLQVQGQVSSTVAQLDSVTGNLISQVNNLTSSGQGTQGFTTVTSTQAVSDPAAALNDPKSGLITPPTNGSFVVHVKDTATGLTTSTLVKVSLTGNPATDTTMNSLQAQLAGIAGVNATVANGKLTLSAAANGQQISFSQDSSGALAVLGINTFFTGSTAGDIGVNAALAADPSMLTASKNGDPGDNQTAKAIAALQTQPVTALGGASLSDAYQSMVTDVANSVSTAKSDVTATKAVVDTLQAQRQALSGVSLDEEAVNLVQQQQAYTAAARLISTVNNMINTLMAITIT